MFLLSPDSRRLVGGNKQISVLLWVKHSVSGVSGARHLSWWFTCTKSEGIQYCYRLVFLTWLLVVQVNARASPWHCLQVVIFSSTIAMLHQFPCFLSMVFSIGQHSFIPCIFPVLDRLEYSIRVQRVWPQDQYAADPHVSEWIWRSPFWSSDVSDRYRRCAL